MTGVTCAEIGKKSVAKVHRGGRFSEPWQWAKEGKCGKNPFPNKRSFRFQFSARPPPLIIIFIAATRFSWFFHLFTIHCVRVDGSDEEGPRQCLSYFICERNRFTHIENHWMMKHIRQDFCRLFVCYGNMNNTSSWGTLNGNMLDLFRVCASEDGKAFCFNLISCLKDTCCYQSLLWDKCGKLFHHNLGFVFRKRAWSICVFFNPVSSLFIRHGCEFVSNVVERGNKTTFCTLGEECARIHNPQIPPNLEQTRKWQYKTVYSMKSVSVIESPRILFIHTKNQFSSSFAFSCCDIFLLFWWVKWNKQARRQKGNNLDFVKMFTKS